MGIPGLLQFLASAREQTHISRFKGHAVGVDASGWMHRSLSTCARELATGVPTVKHVQYCLSLVRVIRKHGVEPLLVFDGAPVAQKALTNAQRGDVRKAARREVDSRREAGIEDEDERRYRKAVGVPAEMVQQLIAALRAERVAFIVAPYEADAQLSFLCRTGQIAAVISEDSDLLAYGTPRVLFKFERDGSAELLALDDLECAEDAKHGGHLFAGMRPREWEEWRAGLFLDMCILAGCDYLHALPGVGIRTAHSLLRAHRCVRLAVAERLGADQHAREYLRHFETVREVFRHQLVWDGQAVVPLTPFPADWDLGSSPHVGLMLSQQLARSICVEATIDARTLEPVRAVALPVPLSPAQPRPEPARSEQPSRCATAAAAASWATPGLKEDRAEPDDEWRATVFHSALPTARALETRSRFFGSESEEGHLAREQNTSPVRMAALPARPHQAPSERASPGLTKQRPLRGVQPPQSSERASVVTVAPFGAWERAGGPNGERARVGLAPTNPPVLDRAVLACIDRLCPLSASPPSSRKRTERPRDFCE